MPTHFNAFISYRHHPIDSKIAQTIHRSLERFHIPRAIQKATGVKKIDRIFRDKEELPLSINLSDDITSALVHSDFLIVICTPRLKESAWCRREIEFFMQLHGRERILIVLGEGEPDDVVPDILMKDQEPLCCDYRMKPRQAKQIELPRLAAAILGCRYDDLVQRQRQYRNRRIAAAASVVMAGALALAGYYYKTSREIQANYEQSLRNQSQYLASTSQELLAAGDRLTAIHLALEAVPSEGNERPWIADAEFALGEAVGIYQSEPLEQNIASLNHKGTVLGCRIMWGGKHLVTWDDTNTLYVWETANYDLVRTIPTNCILEDNGYYNSKSEILMAGEGKLILINGSIFCYDYLSGEPLWVWDEGQVYIGDVNLKRGLVAAANDNDLWVLDLNTGECKIHEEREFGSWLEDLRFSADGSQLAFSVLDKLAFGEESDDLIMNYDLDQGRFLTIPVDDLLVRQLHYSDDNVLLAILETWNEQMPSGTLYSEYMTTESRQLYVLCVDLKNEKILWLKAATLRQDSSYYFLDTAQVTNEDGSQKEAVVFGAADRFGILDCQTGDVIIQHEAPGQVVYAELLGDVLFCLTNTGMRCNAELNQEQMFCMGGFPENLAGGLLRNDDYAYAVDSTQVMVYNYGSDDSYQKLETDKPAFYDVFYARSANNLIMRVHQGVTADDPLLRCYDISGHALSWESQTDENFYSYTYLGITENEKYYLGASVHNLEMLRRYDLATGAYEDVALPGAEREQVYFSQAELWKNRFAYIASKNVGESYSDGMREYELYLVNPEDWSVEIVPIIGMPAGHMNTVCLSPGPDENMAVLQAFDDAVLDCYLLDRRTGALIPLLEQLPGAFENRLPVTWAEDASRFAVAANDEIRVYNTQGELLASISCEGRVPDSMYFLPESYELMVLYGDAVLCRYGTDGQLLGNIEICASAAKMDSVSRRGWYVTDYGLIVEAGGVATIIDTDSWIRYAYVPEFLALDPVSDGFIVNVSEDEGDFKCFYKRYTCETLIEKAEQILGDHRMPQEQIKKYGLTD